MCWEGGVVPGYCLVTVLQHWRDTAHLRLPSVLPQVGHLCLSVTANADSRAAGWQQRQHNYSFYFHRHRPCWNSCDEVVVFKSPENRVKI